MISELARPKINLFLHITGKRPDGYHMLESLAVFAETGDRIAAEAGSGLSLSIDGPFGDTLEVSENNLVLKAAMRLQDHAGRPDLGAALLLTKNLPVASGIGGGSADAAATLRVLRRLWALDISDETLAKLSVGIGADVPVCIASTSQIMRGIGDSLTPAPALPPCWIMLVNPLKGIETRAVFATRDAAHTTPPLTGIPDFETLDALAAWLTTHTANDLGHAAQSLMPKITEIETTLRALPGVAFARMSGSGATCFALLADKPAAITAAEQARHLMPGMWVEVAPLSR